MKIVEEILKENLTWKQAVREMDEEYSYIIRSDCDKVVFLTNEEGELLNIDASLEKVYCVPYTDSFTIHRYSTVKITDKALELIKSELYK